MAKIIKKGWDDGDGPVFTGDALTHTGRQISYEKGVGKQISDSFVGREAEVLSRSAYLVDKLGYDSYDYDIFEDGIAHLVGTAYQEEPPEPIYELERNRVEVSVFETDAFLSVNSANKKALWTALKTTPIVANRDPELDKADPKYKVAQEIFDLWHLGVQAVPRGIPVIRRTIHVADTFTAFLLQEMLDKNIEADFFVKVEFIDRDVASLLPQFHRDPRRRYKGRTWGWLKKAARKIRTAQNRFSIAEEWEYGNWPDIYFEAVRTRSGRRLF